MMLSHLIVLMKILLDAIADTNYYYLLYYADLQPPLRNVSYQSILLFQFEPPLLDNIWYNIIADAYIGLFTSLSYFINIWITMIKYHIL